MRNLSEQKHNWRHMMLISFICYVVIVGDIEALANNIEILVNDTVFIQCYTQVSIDIQWHFNSIENYIYAGGRLRGSYFGRSRTEYDNGTYILVIPRVKSEDAGWYNCSEEISGRRISSTHLTVLYSDPVCYSNMHPDGFIGPNTCNLQHENMVFNCVVSFNGTSPHLMWRSLNDNRTLNSSICEDKPNRRNCSLNLTSDPIYDGSIFICQTTASIDSRFNCSVEAIQILYFSSTKDAVKKYVNVSDNVNCSANSNLNVKYKWTLTQNNKTAVLSSNQELLIQKSGIYQCEVNYSIRNYSCLSVVMNVSVESTNGRTTSGTTVLFITLSIGLVFVVLFAGMFIFLRKRRQQISTPLENLSTPLESCIIVAGFDNCEEIGEDVLKINLSGTKEVSTIGHLPTQMMTESTAVVYGNTLFVTGLGENWDKIWKFDARSSNWEYCNTMIRGRRSHSVAFVDHVLYICCGLDYDENKRIFLEDVEAYDTIDDRCITVGKLVHAIHSSGNCVPFNSSLYIFGGIDVNGKSVDYVQVYDTKLNSCTLLSKRMPSFCRLLRAVLWENEAILLGCHDCLTYNFDTGTWQVRDQFKIDVIHFGLIVHDAKLFAIGGIERAFAYVDGNKKKIYRDDVRSVPVANVLSDESIEWSHHAKLPKPTAVFIFGKMEFLEQ